MPNSARVLRFPARTAAIGLSVAEALRLACSYLAVPIEGRGEDFRTANLSNPDILAALCDFLREQANRLPALVEVEASDLYSWLSTRKSSVGLLDESDYFLGEMALLAGNASRHVGKREDAERWLDRADASFRHTVNAGPQLARASYARLALRFDMERYDDVIEFLPSVSLAFQRLGMADDAAKCHFLEAVTLKELGREEEAASSLEELIGVLEGRREGALRGAALVNLGDIRSSQGNFGLAIGLYRQAMPLLQAAKRYSLLADLKAMLGETLRRNGHIAASLESYREAVKDNLELGMVTRAAYLRILLAGVLLEAGRSREAEWEILAALPTIDEQRMVPEGFAAVALLRESVRQRKTDPVALRELREHLQAKN
jgi:tetratricopeptide (TPR) repeat protein